MSGPGWSDYEGVRGRAAGGMLVEVRLTLSLLVLHVGFRAGYLCGDEGILVIKEPLVATITKLPHRF